MTTQIPAPDPTESSPRVGWLRAVARRVVPLDLRQSVLAVEDPVLALADELVDAAEHLARGGADAAPTVEALARLRRRRRRRVVVAVGGGVVGRGVVHGVRGVALQARVSEVGVVSQSDDTVTVQAFVNQARTSETQKEPAIDQNRVLATMTRVGNRWLVSGLKAY